MSDVMPGRPLEDLLADLVVGVTDAARTQAPAADFTRLRPTSVAFDLPVETRVGIEGDTLIVRADLPALRTRTVFDRPLGRLSFTVTEEAVS
jgi:hypothetical protein